MENATDTAMNLIDAYLIPWGIKIGLAVAIFIIGRMLAKWLVKILEKGLTKSGMDDMLVNFIGNIVGALLLVFVVLAALDQLGVNTTSLAVVFGALSIGIGFGLCMPISGVVIMSWFPANERPYMNTINSALP